MKKQISRLSALLPRRPSFGFMMGWLLAILLLYPYAEGSDRRGHVLALAYVILLLSVLRAICQRKRDVFIALAFGAPMLALQVLVVFSQRTSFYLAWLLLSVGLMGFAIYQILGHLFRQRRATLQMLWAGITVYLLTGFLCASLYTAMTIHDPDTFRMPGIEDPRFSDMLYFSFVTLSTLGYGDIVPVSTKARSVAILESTLGVLYIATIIGRLAAISVNSDDEKEPEE